MKWSRFFIVSPVLLGVLLLLTLAFNPFATNRCEITLESIDISKEGDAVIRYRASMTAGSALRLGFHGLYSGTEDQLVEGVRARSFPGWEATEEGTLNLGRFEESRTKMKEKPEVRRSLFQRSLLVNLGKPYVLRERERLDLARGHELLVYCELK